MLIDCMILILLLFLSAFFSGSETAFMNLKLHRKGIPSRFKTILKNEKLFLTSVLSANTIVNISIAVKCVQLTTELIHHLDLADYLLWMVLGMESLHKVSPRLHRTLRGPRRIFYFGEPILRRVLPAAKVIAVSLRINRASAGSRQTSTVYLLSRK